MTNPYRLPGNAEPIFYNLCLTPNLEKFTFSGKIQIGISIKNPTRTVTLHSVDLRITRTILVLAGSAELLKPRTVRTDRKLQTITLTFERVLPAGKANLYFSFNGKLNDQMRGFYRTSYQVNGETRWGCATQFEATDARRCFPCFDEPDLKAHFKVALVVPQNLTALSNMPVEMEWGLNSEKIILYLPTPRMSTYLLAFVVAELECLESKDRNNIPIRVWTTPGKKEQGEFALSVACHTLPYYSDWFGLPFALPKMDLVALPDFASEAMENWGLITFRETALLVDPENSAAANKEWVAHVVDHELAHQWFGNSTTMKWWTDLWLNEGFADFMGPMAVDHQFPEWDVWNQFVAKEFLSAITKDGLSNTHPIEIDVKNPDEIREIFDSISYAKGSVVCRMLQVYLGEELFQKGLRIYLERHQLGNAETKDLWQALEEVSGKPIKDLMAGYTRQPGYPAITVSAKNSRGRTILELKQHRFILNGRRLKRQLWKVPIGIAGPELKKPLSLLMEDAEKTLAIPEVPETSFIKINPGQTGFYRVAYSAELWRGLKEAVSSKSFSASDRLGLVDDCFALARSGDVATATALDFLKAYDCENDLSVWLAVSDRTNEVCELLEDSNSDNPFRHFAREIFKNISLELGWEKLPTDTSLTLRLRSLVLRHYGYYGDPATIREAQKRFWEFTRGGTLDANLRQTVYSLVAENGGEKEFQALLKIYEDSELHEEKVRVLRALGAFTDPLVLEKVLALALSEKIRTQDVYSLLRGAAAKSRNTALVWKFLKANWRAIDKRLRSHDIGLIIESVIGKMNTLPDYQDAKRFFRNKKIPGSERSLRQALERAESNIAWLKRDRRNILAWLASNSD